MRYLIEIYLTAWEWIQDRRGRADARRTQPQTETKTIRTFLSQGAIGGAIGYFLLMLYVLLFYPRTWSFVYLFILPIFLAIGASLGIFISVFVWLGSLVFKRKLSFVARAIIVARRDDVAERPACLRARRAPRHAIGAANDRHSRLRSGVSDCAADRFKHQTLSLASFRSGSSQPTSRVRQLDLLRRRVSASRSEHLWLVGNFFDLESRDFCTAC